LKAVLLAEVNCSTVFLMVSAPFDISSLLDVRENRAVSANAMPHCKL
jgi:hypothetical protein